MKRKRIPKKANADASSNEFDANKSDSTIVDQSGEQTTEKTLNTWEMKENSPVLDRDLNTEKTLNTWEMSQNTQGEVNDAEDSQTTESEEYYTESDSENTSYEFI